MTMLDSSSENRKILKKFITDRSIPLSPLKTDAIPSLSPNNDIKAVLFDIYGTLLISGSGDIGTSREKDIHYPVADIFEDSGFELQHNHLDTRIAKLMRLFIQNKHRELKEKGIEYPEVDIIEIWRQIVKQLIEDKILDSDGDAIQLRKLALLYELKVNPVWLMPNALDILTALKDEGYPLGIVSNAQFYTPLTFEALSGKELIELGFNLELCSWSYSIMEAKPSVNIFRDVLKGLKVQNGINPEQTLYIGNDMLNDIYTAQSCGCLTALFAGDSRSYRLRTGHPLVQDVKPDYIITDLSQIKTILESGEKNG